jgi:hypothetical protein
MDIEGWRVGGMRLGEDRWECGGDRECKRLGAYRQRAAEVHDLDYLDA